jgi:hypothetical protein
MSCDISSRKLDVLVDGCEIGVEVACANAAKDMGFTSGYMWLTNRQNKEHEGSSLISPHPPKLRGTIRLWPRILGFGWRDSSLEHRHVSEYVKVC